MEEEAESILCVALKLDDVLSGDSGPSAAQPVSMLSVGYRLHHLLSVGLGSYGRPVVFVVLLLYVTLCSRDTIALVPRLNVGVGPTEVVPT